MEASGKAAKKEEGKRERKTTKYLNSAACDHIQFSPDDGLAINRNVGILINYTRMFNLINSISRFTQKTIVHSLQCTVRVCITRFYNGRFNWRPYLIISTRLARLSVPMACALAADIDLPNRVEILNGMKEIQKYVRIFILPTLITKK